MICCAGLSIEKDGVTRMWPEVKWFLIALGVALVTTVAAIIVPRFYPGDQVADWLRLLDHPRRDVISTHGEPDAVLHSEEDLGEQSYSAWHHSTRPFEGPVLVYFHDDEMIEVYLDDNERVISVHFGERVVPQEDGG